MECAYTVSILSHSVLVSLVSHKKINTIDWLLSNRNLFLTVVEAEKFKIKASECLISGETLLSDS